MCFMNTLKYTFSAGRTRRQGSSPLNKGNDRTGNFAFDLEDINFLHCNIRYSREAVSQGDVVHVDVVTRASANDVQRFLFALQFMETEAPRTNRSTPVF
jgi:hypothetical protein